MSKPLSAINEDALKELHRIFKYDSITGIIYWNISYRSYKPGMIAGKKRKDGYITVAIVGRRFAAHRLAWVLHYGLPIPKFLDHKNRIRHDNRIVNLRECNDAQNHANTCKQRRNNKSGYRGVIKTSAGTWKATIGYNKKKIYVGTFKDPRKAQEAYTNKALELYGEFVP